MATFGMPACYCQITYWSNKVMFIALWMIDHVDQHTCHIVCKHLKNGMPCHYMTGREADIKQTIHKLHNAALKELLATNWYMKENAWLDLTSSWSIKHIEKRYKTFPENHTGATMRLLVWVIMDHKAEDPRGKSNTFRVPPYVALDCQKIISLGAYTSKEMYINDATRGEDSQPSKPIVTSVQVGNKRIVRPNQRLK